MERTWTTQTKNHEEKNTKPKVYTMNLKCSNKRDDSESVVVIAKDYHKAFGEVWEEILRTISKGAGQVDNLGIQYSYKGVKVLKATKRRHAGGLMVP